jgi:hypothetical protein
MSVRPDLHFVDDTHSVADSHHLDGDPDPNPAFHFDVDPVPTFQFDSDPDLVASMLQNYPIRLSPFHFNAEPDPVFHFATDPDPYSVFLFDADPDQNEDPASQNDADPCGGIRIRNTGYARQYA